MKKKVIKTLVKLTSIFFKYTPFISSFFKKRSKAKLINIELKLDNIQKEFKIGIMSDLHLGWTSNEEEIKGVFRKMKEEGVKAIFILGDIVENKIEDLTSLREIIKEAPGVKVFCIPGNHEHMADPGLINIREKLINRGVTLVINETLVLEGKFGKFYVDCLDDPIKGFPDFDKLKFKEEPRILLCHSPEILAWGSNESWNFKKMLNDNLVRFNKEGYKEYKYEEGAVKIFMNQLNVCMAFFGHTHGGQIAKIGKYALNKESYSRNFLSGKYEVGKDKEIYVLNGLGNTAIPFRIGVDTEAYILTIKNKEEKKS